MVLPLQILHKSSLHSDANNPRSHLPQYNINSCPKILFLSNYILRFIWYIYFSRSITGNTWPFTSSFASHTSFFCNPVFYTNTSIATFTIFAIAFRTNNFVRHNSKLWLFPNIYYISNILHFHLHDLNEIR